METIYAEAFRIFSPPASAEELRALSSAAGPLPASYISFLSITNGADGALNQTRVALRLYSVSLSLECNIGYQIQVWLPRLWMIGDDSGDYAYCVDRDPASAPDSWRIVEVPMGALFEDDVIVVSPSFSAWQKSQFRIEH